MIKEAIQIVVEGKSLSIDAAATVMEEIMSGQVTPSQFGSFVTALRIKGETIEEIAGFARTMRSKAVHVKSNGVVVDTCGTGGDGADTFNISTTAAFIVSGAGLKVAKHGNRAMSSKSGSADVLETLGVKIELAPEQVEKCLNEVGIGFMFAQVFHPSMKYASAPRREIGIRTVFNILGPLTNPAEAKAQVIGVPSEQIGSKVAQALAILGTSHTFIVHGLNGIDEISITGPSRIWEICHNEIADFYTTPEDFGFKRASISTIKGGVAGDNAQILRNVLSGKKGPCRDIAVMNAAAGIMAGTNIENTIHPQGIKTLVQNARKAEEAIDNGQALEKLEQMIKITRSFRNN
jgi:anthranilate phosphoribosyltransferase